MTETPDLDPSLRTVSDTFVQQLDRLMALEERKRETPVDDEGFPALAREVEDAARALLERAQEQTARAEETHTQAVAEGVSAMIEDIPEDLTPSGILRLWREAERELLHATEGTEERRRLTARVETLRAAYQRAYRREG
jgi:hypothetical protein